MDNSEASMVNKAGISSKAIKEAMHKGTSLKHILSSNMVCSNSTVVNPCISNSNNTSHSSLCTVNRASPCLPSKRLHGDQPLQLMGKSIITIKTQVKQLGISQPVCLKRQLKLDSKDVVAWMIDCNGWMMIQSNNCSCILVLVCLIGIGSEMLPCSMPLILLDFDYRRCIEWVSIGSHLGYIPAISHRIISGST